MGKTIEYVYGLHTVRHALVNSPERVLTVWVQDNKKNNPDAAEILRLSGRFGIHHEYVSRSTLDRHTAGANHQGIAVKLKPVPTGGMNELDDILDRNKDTLPLFLVLDGIQDPQNLGACIRTANAAGVDAVIIPRDKSVAVTSTVRKVASGGVENTPVITVTNLARAINRLQTAGIWIVGTDNNADKTLYELDLAIPLAIVMGAEGKGLRRNTREHCDYLASLPMHGMVESLNVSVAAGVCLYETLRQRGLR